MLKEWLDLLSKEILNPDYALFTQSVDGKRSPTNEDLPWQVIKLQINEAL